MDPKILKADIECLMGTIKAALKANDYKKADTAALKLRESTHALLIIDVCQTIGRDDLK